MTNASTQTSPGNNAAATVTATCPAGEAATGGGGAVSNQGPTPVELYASIPVGNNAWAANAQQVAAGSNVWTLTVYVVCSR